MHRVDDMAVITYLLRLQLNEAWKLDAECRGLDPNMFYPERGGSTSEAKAVCARCPVQEQCNEAGMYEDFGIWGGKSARMRHREAGSRRKLDRRLVHIA